MKKSREMLYNLLLLTVSALVMRFVAMAFNVYIAGKIGASGMGLYSLTMSVGAFGITLALSGINFAATRLVAAALGHESENEVKGVMKSCIVYALIFGFFSFSVLYITAEPISVKFLHDSRCTVLIRVFAVSLPFISLTTALGGYFTAVRRVYKGAVGAFFEQGLKIFLCVWLIGLIAPKGTKYACLAVMLGTSLSQIASFALSLVLYFRDRKRNFAGNNKSIKNIPSKLLEITVPISLGTYVRSGLVTLEHLIIPTGLRKFGIGSTLALAAYGTLQEMALPVILFPQAFVAALSALLVPEISEKQARLEFDEIDGIIEKSFKITMCFSFGVAGIILLSSNRLGSVIFPNTDAGFYIALLSPLIPIMYLDHVVDGALKGFGEQVYSMRINIIDAFLSVILVWILVPKCGILGYIITIYLMEIVNASFSILRLIKVCNAKFSIYRFVIKPLAAVILTSAVIGIFRNILPVGGLSDTLVLILDMTFTFVVYSVILTATRTIKKDDFKIITSTVK